MPHQGVSFHRRLRSVPLRERLLDQQSAGVHVFLYHRGQRDADIGLETAFLADKLGQPSVLVGHPFALGGRQFRGPARSPRRPPKVRPDRSPKRFNLTCGLLPDLVVDSWVRRANDSFAEAWVQVLGMQAEKDVARLPDLARRVEKLLFNGGVGSIVVEVRVVTPIDPVSPVDIRSSEERHALIVRFRPAVCLRDITRIRVTP